jgi:hypothetical protein
VRRIVSKSVGCDDFAKPLRKKKHSARPGRDAWPRLSGSPSNGTLMRDVDVL